MDLSVGERLALFVVLPKEGSFDTLRAVRELRERLALTEQERKDINFRQEAKPEPQWVWDKHIVKPFDFSEGDVALLREGLNLVSGKGAAQEIHLTLYEKLPPTGNGKVKDHDQPASRPVLHQEA